MATDAPKPADQTGRPTRRRQAATAVDRRDAEATGAGLRTSGEVRPRAVVTEISSLPEGDPFERIQEHTRGRLALIICVGFTFLTFVLVGGYLVERVAAEVVLPVVTAYAAVFAAHAYFYFPRSRRRRR